MKTILRNIFGYATFTVGMALGVLDAMVVWPFAVLTDFLFNYPDFSIKYWTQHMHDEVFMKSYKTFVEIFELEELIEALKEL